MVRQSKQTVRNARCSHLVGSPLNQPPCSFNPIRHRLRSPTRRGMPTRKERNSKTNPPQRNPQTPLFGPAGSTAATKSSPERPISSDTSARLSSILCPDCTCSANYRGIHTHTPFTAPVPNVMPGSLVSVLLLFTSCIHLTTFQTDALRRHQKSRSVHASRLCNSLHRPVPDIMESSSSLRMV